MKYLKYSSILLFFSCIDLITQEEQYNSLYFSGGSWIEFEQIDSIQLESGNFTFQFWVSGGEIDTNEAPTLFSLIDQEDSIKFALFREKGNISSIITIINEEAPSAFEIFDLDWSDSDKFYLISLLFSKKNNMIKGYLNDNLFLEYTAYADIDDATFMVGALANTELTILENFWYGYIDEIRLWNTNLSDTTIAFQSKNPNKLSENYRFTDEEGNEVTTYLDSLIGIWRLNFEKPETIIEDGSGYNNNGNIYTLINYSVELSKKGIE